MANTPSIDFTDFTKGHTNGWEVVGGQNGEIIRDRDNYFYRSDAPYAYNGVDFQKDINFDVGKPFKFSIKIRTQSDMEKMIGVQVIVGNGYPGAQIALRVELEPPDIKHHEWQTLEGYIFLRVPVGSDEVIVNIYSFRSIDVDDMSIDLTPTEMLSKDEPVTKRQL